jgi:hypothetical protein
VLADDKPLLDELGVDSKPNVSEAIAAARLGASINYSVHGVITWASIVGTYVASCAVTNCAFRR